MTANEKLFAKFAELQQLATNLNTTIDVIIAVYKWATDKPIAHRSGDDIRATVADKLADWMASLPVGARVVSKEVAELMGLDPDSKSDLYFMRQQLNKSGLTIEPAKGTTWVKELTGPKKDDEKDDEDNNK